MREGAIDEWKRGREKLREEVSRLLRGGWERGGLCVQGGWGWEVCTFHHLLRCKKKRSVLMKAGQDSFCMEGLAVGREAATSWAAASG